MENFLELAPYKYAGYTQLIKTIRLETQDDSLFSKTVHLLAASAELCYYTLACSALNAEQLRRENGLEVCRNFVRNGRKYISYTFFVPAGFARILQQMRFCRRFVVEACRYGCTSLLPHLSMLYNGFAICSLPRKIFANFFNF